MAGDSHASPSEHVHVDAKRVLVAGSLTIVAAAVEFWVSIRAGSRFLSADAVHLLAHLAIFFILLLPQRGSHAFREDVLACAVLAIVVVIALVIGLESVRAFFEHRAAPAPAALLFSLLGLTANAVTARLFVDPARRRWSFRAALAHEISDGALTVAGLVGALAIALFRWRWVDPVLSLTIAIWLEGWAGRLLIRRVREGAASWS